MAVRPVVLAALIPLVLGSSQAIAQRTTSDALIACERYAAVDFKRRNPAFRRFVIDRSGVTVDRFADKVGSQFVSAIYHGHAFYDAGTGPRVVRFLCLYAMGRGPLFVYTLD